jgi:hypothetical protein
VYPFRARAGTIDPTIVSPEQTRQVIAGDTQMAPGLSARCFSAASESEIEQSQRLAPDPLRARSRARGAQIRDAHGRFAKGYSGNPTGRPRGIRNPRRRPIGLLLRQARPGTLVPLIDRKPYLRLPVVLALMGPPARRPDPGDRLGIEFSRLGSAQEVADAMRRVLDALCGGEITLGEAKRLTRRSRKSLRQIRRLMRREIAALKQALRDRRRAPAKFPDNRGQIPCSQGIPLAPAEVDVAAVTLPRACRASIRGRRRRVAPRAGPVIEPARRSDYFRPLGPLHRPRHILWSPQWRWRQSRSTTNTRWKKAAFT